MDLEGIHNAFPFVETDKMTYLSVNLEFEEFLREMEEENEKERTG